MEETKKQLEGRFQKLETASAIKIKGLEQELERLQIRNRELESSTISSKVSATTQLKDKGDIQSRLTILENKNKELYRLIKEIELNSTNQITSIKERISSKLSFFHGKPLENLENWIFNVERAFGLEKVPKNEWPEMAAKYLKDSAQEVFQTWTMSNYHAKKVGKWEDMCEFFCALYRPANYGRLLRIRLDKLKQTGSYQDYVMRFLNIVNQLGNMSEQDKVHRFIAGLASINRSELQYKSPDTLLEAMNFAHNHDLAKNKPSWKRSRRKDK